MYHDSKVINKRNIEHNCTSSKMISFSNKWVYQRFWKIIYLITIVPYLGVVGYPSGGLQLSCIDLVPGHGQPPKTMSKPLFAVTTNTRFYDSEEELILTLTSKSGMSFRGFMLHVISAHKLLIGNFTYFDEHDVQAYQDENGDSTCLTHTESTPKTSITVHWKPPAGLTDTVYVGVIFVENYDLAYTMPHALTLQSSPSMVAKNIRRQVPISPVVSELVTRCGIDYGCMMFPNYCTTTCQILVTYQPIIGQSQHIRISLYAKNFDYVSLGISADVFMGEDETFSCLRKGGNQTELQHGYNPGYFNEHYQMEDVMTEVTTLQWDNWIFCQVIRERRIDMYDFHQEKYITFDFEKEFYLFIAWGETEQFPGAVPRTYMRKHREHPVVSNDYVHFYEPAVIDCNSLPPIIRVHGATGLIAWFPLVGISIITMRHYKEVFGLDHEGTPMSFQVHQALAFAILVLTIISISFVFSSVGTWAKYSVTHAGFGFTVLTLLIVLLTSGWQRPDESVPLRKDFSVLHKTLGVFTFLLGYQTIFGSMDIPLVNKHIKTPFIYITWIWLFYILINELLLEVLWFFTHHTFCKKRGISPEKEEFEKVEEGEPMSSRIWIMGAKIIYAQFVLGNICLYFLCVLLLEERIQQPDAWS